ncbi:DNA-directed RNA polymerase sigma-70 factor [Sphingomonas metalli]|uniref:DNA-directed RNA polymerase sigma-70 factor n=1 Tax=Sphingomonas metalli TaxID=1779358 RepID=A0A916SZ00_9SPHN|nr:FliA/WhiG family RNA polymerase sigma factor [Sphingomonas metalli]GGB23568.1 DNA-directed RNA polymerase sigma-70 factor [Sphingomonas metalli]
MSAEPMKGAFQSAAPAAAGDFAGPLTYRPAQKPRGEGEALIRQHLPLVRRIAWHVHGSMSTLVEVEDLIQVGLVALVEAAAGFEDRGQVTFKHYLATRLRGAMIDELRRQATTTRGAMRRRKQYAEAVQKLTALTGHKPDEGSLAAQLGVSVERLRSEYVSAEAVRFDSIDEVYADDLPWFADDTPDAFAQLAEGEMREKLIAAIAALPEREAQVIQLYYVEELNLEEIGQVFGVGSARICQIKASAHARLKKAMRG